MTIHTFLKNVKSIISFIKDNGFDIFLNVIFAISIISVFFLIFLIISPLLASSFPIENGAVSDDQLLQKVIKGYISFFLSIQNALLTSNSSIHSEAEINYGLNGDAFGVINPFIAFLAAILTFIAFLTQYMANRKMLQDNRKQQAERQFYEMLRINQINVENIQIPQVDERFIVKGHEAFRILNKEFRYIYENTKKGKNKKDDFNRAYEIFFFGQERLTDNEKKEINEIGCRQSIIPTLVFAQGHVYQFDHYYRHFYCMVRFIANSKIFSSEEKFDFLRIIRAQTTSDEQVLLLYNWYSGFGNPWENAEIGQHFLSKYQMIHNIFSSSTIFSDDEIFKMFPHASKHDKEQMFENFKPSKV